MTTIGLICAFILTLGALLWWIEIGGFLGIYMIGEMLGLMVQIVYNLFNE